MPDAVTGLSLTARTGLKEVRVLMKTSFLNEACPGYSMVDAVVFLSAAALLLSGMHFLSGQTAAFTGQVIDAAEKLLSELSHVS